MLRSMTDRVFDKTEPTNEEMWRNWCWAVRHAPFVLIWLWIEARVLDQAWAYDVLAHGLPFYLIAAAFTFRRNIVLCLASVSIALWVALKAFGATFWDELMNQVRITPL